MSNRRGSNTYAKNNFKSYNQGFDGPVQRFYMNDKPFTEPRNATYKQEYQSNNLLTGGDVSGTVFINNSYDVRTEDPGLSWIL
jgi:hypothetical protein